MLSSPAWSHPSFLLRHNRHSARLRKDIRQDNLSLSCLGSAHCGGRGDKVKPEVSSAPILEVRVSLLIARLQFLQGGNSIEELVEQDFKGF